MTVTALMEQGNRSGCSPGDVVSSTRTVYIPQAELVNVQSVFHSYLRVSAEISPFVSAKEDPFSLHLFVELFLPPCLMMV